MSREKLRSIVVSIIDHLERGGVEMPADLRAFKTTAHYALSLKKNVRQLYNGEMSEAEFVDLLLVLVDEQLTRAWNEGMRENGLDPKEDMIDEWAEVLQDTKLSELDYVDDFAAEIVQGASSDKEKNTDSLPGFIARADLWANRYTDTVNLAILTTAGGKDRLEWVYGDTEHCSTCLNLNGIVAFASEWELADVHPQGPPNEALDCGGWKCQCSLRPTDKRRSRNAWDKIMDALG